MKSSESGLLLTFALDSKDALVEPVFGVGPDVAVVAGVLVELSCSLTFKGDFSLLSSSFSAAEETASVTSTASNPSSICSSRLKFKRF